jgi:hypothetical protein
VTGLTNGTAYRFTVVTINASGSGAGATSGAVTPVEAPTVTLVPSAMSVQAGAGLTVSGRLTGSGGRALGGVLVMVLYRPNASTPWSGVAGYTAADGTYPFPVTASQTRTYVATVSPVTGVRASAASPEVTITAS